jgi:hypothetical protein
MHFESLISTEETSRGGGDVSPADTMMKDGMDGKGWMVGSMGRFRASETLGPTALFPSTAFESTSPS